MLASDAMCARTQRPTPRGERRAGGAAGPERPRGASETFEKLQRNQNRIRQHPPSARWNILESETLARWHLAVAGPDGDARSPAARAPITRYIHAYNFTCTRYYKTVETRARKTESPRCSGSTSSAAAPERTLTRTRAHTNTCTIQLYLRRWLYVRSPAQRLSPHVERVLHIVHPCTMVDSQPAMSNTSAHLTYSEFDPTTQCPRRS